MEIPLEFLKIPSKSHWNPTKNKKEEFLPSLLGEKFLKKPFKEKSWMGFLGTRDLFSQWKFLHRIPTRISPIKIPSGKIRFGKHFGGILLE